MSSRTTMLRRFAATTTALGIATAGALTLSVAPATAALTTIETPFAYQGWAYGTKVAAESGGASVGSGPTARSLLGCTKLAPKAAKPNYLTNADLNSMLTVGALDSRVNTYRRPAKKLFGTRSVNVLSDVVLGDPTGPHLTIGAVRTTSNAFNRGGKFGATNDIKWFGLEAHSLSSDGSGTPLDDLLGAIEGGLNQVALDVIAEAGVIDIPGVGSIQLGSESKRVARNAATARTYGLKVVLESGATASLGHAWARIRRDVPFNVLNGSAHASQATTLQDGVRVGRVANQPLPCQGTGGQWLTTSAANVNLPGFRLAGPTGEVLGEFKSTGRSIARTRAYLSEVNLGDGQLVVKGVRGQVNVVANREGRIVARNLLGTSVGSITANGEPHEAPLPGEELEIPGVAKIEVAVRRNIGTRGVAVTALRITLLDGSGAVVNLGNARARINRA